MKARTNTGSRIKPHAIMGREWHREQQLDWKWNSSYNMMWKGQREQEPEQQLDRELIIARTICKMGNRIDWLYSLD